MASQQDPDWRQVVVNIAEGIKTEIDTTRADLDRVLIEIGESYVNGEEKSLPASVITRARKLTARLEGLSWCYQLPTGYLGGMFIVPKKTEPPATQ